MAQNYSPALAHDKNNEPLPFYPSPLPTKQVTVAVPPATSSVITFGANSTKVEVSAANGPVAIRWGTGSVIAIAGTANFDHVVPANTVRTFVIPQSVQGVTGSVVGANVLNGLYTSMAVITMSSTLSAVNEY